MSATDPRIRTLKAAMVALAAVALTSTIGQLATQPNLEPWYAGLIKPAFNPPNWVFAPVWTALYVFMAFAVWRVLCLPRDTQGRRLALILFFTQLGMNGAWSWMFFGAQSPVLGMVNIVPQLALVLLTIAAFRRLDRLAGMSLLPLAGWVTFASALNFEIWRLNG